VIFKQPASHSLELNLLDLGGWRSLDSLVERIDYDPNSKVPKKEILRRKVWDAWERWEGSEKIKKLIAVKKRVI
jgi:hypothetical protein